MAPRFSKLCFTLNNPVPHPLEVIARCSNGVYVRTGTVRYICFQLEEGDSGTRHWQGYIQFLKPIGLRLVGRLLGGNPHIEVQRGSNVQARDYCKKIDSRIEGPWEWGTFCEGPGERVDLAMALELMAEGGLHAVAVGAPEVFVRNHRGLRALELELAPPRTSKPIVTVITGETGVMKTRSVMGQFPDTFNEMLTPQRGTHWFDGWNGQSPILFDEFQSELWAIQFFLKLCDHYPCSVKIHGGVVRVGNGCTDVFILSNVPPHEWWRGESTLVRAAFARRVDFCYTMEHGGVLIESELGF